MEIRTVIILAIILNTCHKIESVLSGIPRDTEVKVNDSTYLNCSTSLLANQVQWRHGNNYVYTEIAILEPYNERFSVEINASTGACNLVIRSAQHSDAGTYECAEDEGFGEQRTAQLIVLDDDPICKSNMHSDGVIGPNSCGTEPEDIKLSCSIEFHGNILPVLEWKARLSDENQSITDGLIDVTSTNNEVTYTLTMNSSLGMNNSSFICQTSRTSDSDKHYSCSSEVINILYVFSSEVKVNMTMNDELNCLANTTQSCSYKWKWFHGDDSSTESDNQNLKPKKIGMHRCEATCSIRNKSCFVHSMHATVDFEEATSGRSRMALLVLLLVPALGVVGVIVYCWRKRMERPRLDEITVRPEVEDQQRLLAEAIELQRREEEERQRLLGLIATIRTKATREKQKAIAGLTILDNELFVVSDECSEVEIYDSTKFSLSRQWTLKELLHPWDIVSCHINKCLYIIDRKISGLSREISRVNTNGKLLKKWSTKMEFGLLSVTYDSNVIFVATNKNKLTEYKPDGQFVLEIYLSSDEGFCHPRHAIKLTNGHFVVSHGSGKYEDDLQRVCIVNKDGKLLKSFGGQRGSTIGQTHVPTYLSVDRSGSVMVADYYNSRILLLDSNLEFKREIVTREHGLRNPRRILLDESNSRLFVSEHDQNNFQIMIFDFGLLRQARNVTFNS